MNMTKTCFVGFWLLSFAPGLIPYGHAEMNTEQLGADFERMGPDDPIAEMADGAFLLPKKEVVIPAYRATVYLGNVQGNYCYLHLPFSEKRRTFPAGKNLTYIGRSMSILRTRMPDFSEERTFQVRSVDNTEAIVRCQFLRGWDPTASHFEQLERYPFEIYNPLKKQP